MAKILLIDDDPDLVMSMKLVLESKGYQVDSASNGDEGLKKAAQSIPDVIILDIMMENKDEGFDVARAIRKQKRLKNIPILVVTSMKGKTGFDFKKEAGNDAWLPVDDYCDKPLKPQELLDKVQKLLKK